MTIPTLDDIRAARERISSRLRRTPTLPAGKLGAPANVDLSLKCELFQKTGSFKTRGALNAILQLSEDERKRGVVTVSAGNHAQAVGWAAAAAGISSTVVMPVAATKAKVEASRGYGANVVLHGASGAEAFAKANELAAERGLVFIHPFDDPRVLAGAGTTALELMEDAPDTDAVVIGIGGGGLASGMSIALRALKPSIRIFGVEPEGSAALRKSLDAGRPIRLESSKTIADGLAAPMAGDVTYPIIRDLMDDVVLVSDAEIAAAMGSMLTYAKLMAEPAGAAAVASILSGRLPLAKGARVAAVVSGGNVDLTRLCELIAGPSA